ncbi:MAG: DUF4357 domain-containing protein [Alphaproteobacteria bacterium]
MEADLYDNFETIRILVSTLGLPVFQKLKEDEKKNPIFECKNTKGYFGKGEYTEEGFVIFKGAICSKELSKRFIEYGAPSIREKLIREKILIEVNNNFELSEDTLISSPSTASQLILGRPSNGWTDWKTSDGKTLDQIYRQKK